jgi:hypothetical protein
MPTERQIAANRRNAGKSTGPRSGAGKKRASKNAHSHGLTVMLSSAAFAKQVEQLARKIAGRTTAPIILEHARATAEAELELGRIRRVRLALIERTSALGSLKAPKHFSSVKEETRWLKQIGIWLMKNRGSEPPLPEFKDPSATMPSQEPQRSSEAMRRMLPDLIKLNRYESRAVARRDRAVRQITKERIHKLIQF